MQFNFVNVVCAVHKLKLKYIFVTILCIFNYHNYTHLKEKLIKCNTEQLKSPDVTQQYQQEFENKLSQSMEATKILM